MRDTINAKKRTREFDDESDDTIDARSLLHELSAKHNDLFRSHVVTKLDSNSAKCFSLCARWCKEDVLATKLVISKDFKIHDRTSLQLAVKLGMPLTVSMFNRAIEQGDRNDKVCSMLLKDFSCKVDSTCASCAARFGRITVLELLMEAKVEFTYNAMTRAAFEGHWDVVRWLRERACPWKKSLICSLALVKNGKHMVRYLERQSCLPTDVYSEDEEDAV